MHSEQAATAMHRLDHGSRAMPRHDVAWTARPCRSGGKMAQLAVAGCGCGAGGGKRSGRGVQGRGGRRDARAGRRGADCVWDVERDSPLHLPNVSSSLSPCLSILSCVRKIPLSTRGQWCPLTGPPNCAPEAPVTDGLSDAGSYALCPELCPELPGPNSIRTRALRLARYRSPHRTWSRRRSDCALRSRGSAKAEKEESTQTTGRPGARHTLAPLPHTHILLRAHSSTPLSMYIIYHITSGLSVQYLDIFPFPSFSFCF